MASVLCNNAERTSAAKENIKRRRKQRRDDAAELPDDGFQWHMYGEKPLVNSSFTRTYYRCNQRDRGCSAKKTVDRHQQCSATVRVAYEGKHTHQPPSRAVREVIIFRSPSTTAIGTLAAGNRCRSFPETRCKTMRTQAAPKDCPSEQARACAEAAVRLGGVQRLVQKQPLEPETKQVALQTAPASSTGHSKLGASLSREAPTGIQLGAPFAVPPYNSQQLQPCSPLQYRGLRSPSAPLQSHPLAADTEPARTRFKRCFGEQAVLLSSSSSNAEDPKLPFGQIFGRSSQSLSLPPQELPCLQGLLGNSFMSSVTALMARSSEHSRPWEWPNSLLSTSSGVVPATSADKQGCGKSSSVGSAFSSATAHPVPQAPLVSLPATPFGPRHIGSFLPPQPYLLRPGTDGALFCTSAPSSFTCTIQNGKNLPLSGGDVAACGNVGCENMECSRTFPAVRGRCDPRPQPGMAQNKAACLAGAPGRGGPRLLSATPGLLPRRACDASLPPLTKGCDVRQPSEEERSYLEEVVDSTTSACSPEFPAWLLQPESFGGPPMATSPCTQDEIEGSKDFADLYPELVSLDLSSFGSSPGTNDLAIDSDLTSMDCLAEMSADLFDSSFCSMVSGTSAAKSSCAFLPPLISPSLSSRCSPVL